MRKDGPDETITVLLISQSKVSECKHEEALDPDHLVWLQTRQEMFTLAPYSRSLECLVIPLGKSVNFFTEVGHRCLDVIHGL